MELEPNATTLLVIEKGSVTDSHIRGRVIGVPGIARNITAARQAEDVLRESEASWHDLFDSVDDAIPVGDGRGRVLDINCADLATHTRALRRPPRSDHAGARHQRTPGRRPASPPVDEGFGG